jgi:RimJ/RimL family protein N-acetyltransferase
LRLGEKMRIETERLIIRNFEMKDESDLGEYMLQRIDAEFERYEDFTIEKVAEEIKYRVGSDEFYAIEMKMNGKVVGNIYMGHRDFEAREVGYVLNEDYQSRGYGSEAAKATVDYFLKNGTRRIFAECNPDNIPSWKLMEKIGLKREAHFRKNVSFRKDSNGKPIYWDTYVYARLAEDN